MSKIVCDICGTSYAETAKQCPICGSVRPGDVQRVTNEVKKDGKVSTGYTHVKGGRFSKANVKKRTKAQNAGKSGSKSAPKKNNNDEEKANRGLVLLAIMLLLAIIGVVTYLAIRFITPNIVPDAGNPTLNLGSDSDLTCKELALDTYSITFDQLGISKQLRPETTPEKPTETVTYESTHPEVATVTQKGLITPVANGTTDIIVSCGSITKTCKVTVQLGENNTNNGETTTPTEPDVTTPDDSQDKVLMLMTTNCNLDFNGHRKELFNPRCDISKDEIIWSVKDSNIATINNDGVVEAVSNGTTEVIALYKDQQVICTIVCDFKESSGIEGNGGVSEDGGGSTTTSKTGVIVNVNVDANVRTSPTIKEDNLDGTIKLGAKVNVFEEKYADGFTWYRIGKDRWVASNYVKLDP